MTPKPSLTELRHMRCGDVRERFDHLMRLLVGLRGLTGGYAIRFKNGFAYAYCGDELIESGTNPANRFDVIGALASLERNLVEAIADARADARGQDAD